MKIIFYPFFFFFLIACGGKKDDLVDLKSYTDQGEKIVLVKQKSLNIIDKNLVNNLKKTKNFFYKDWAQSHQNQNNLINPINISIKKKNYVSIKKN